MMGWFGSNNSNDSNDMDTIDDGKEAFVFRDDEDDDEDEETAPAAEQPNQNQFASSFLEIDEQNDKEDEEEDPPIIPRKVNKNEMALNDTEDKDPAADRAPTPSHRNPLFTFRRFWSELCCCQSWFHLTERVNQREIDIPESFAPFSCLAFLWKCIFAGACVGTMTYTFLDAQHPEYVLAFLTQWAALATTLYSIASVVNTIFAARTPQPHAETVGFRIRLTWVLFELAAHLGACASLLFWVFLFDKDEHLEYLQLATHGGLLLLVLFDGLFVNRIPLRWMHYFGIILPIEALYGVWTYVHYKTEIGNPNLDSDDALYPDVVQWDDGWTEPLAYVLVIVFAVGPILFCLLWCAGNGLFCCRDTRRYFDEPIIDDDGRPTVDDVQEGSIFSLWK